MKQWHPGAEAEGEVIIGKDRNQWMIHLFTNEVHALTWVGGDPEARRLWRARVVLGEELEYVPPESGQLRPRSVT